MRKKCEHINLDCKQYRGDPVSKIRGKEIAERREKIVKRNRKSDALATGSHFLRSHFLSQPRRSTGFSLVQEWRSAGEEAGGGEPPFHLPSHDSSQFFFELFVSNFTSASLPRHVLFLFPRLSLCHSRSRRTRSSCFTAFPLLVPVASLPPSFFSLLSPLSIPTLSFSLSLPSFLRPSHPFHDRRSVSLARPSPSFFLSLGRFIASSTTLRSPPSTPLPSLFPFSPRALVPFTHSLFPPTPKTLFSRGPFASTVIRYPPFSASVSLSLPPFFLVLTPTIGRETTSPFSLVPSCISVLALSLPLSLSLLLCGFFFPPLYPSICLFRSVPSPTNPAAFFLLSFSSRLASIRRFFLRRAPFTFFQHYRRVASSLLPGFFPFAGTVLETTANRLFLRENAGGNDRSPSLFPFAAPFSSSRCYFAVSKRGDWNLPRGFPPLPSFAFVLSLSLASR